MSRSPSIALLVLPLILAIACGGEPPVEPPDAGQPDAGEVDAGEVDAGEVDAGEVDAGQPDAGDSDAGPGENRAPILELESAVTLTELQTQRLAFSATDPDGDAVTVTFEGLPTWITRDDGALRLAPLRGHAGNHTFTAIASDGTLSARRDVQVTVQALEPGVLAGTLRIEGGAAATRNERVAVTLAVTPGAGGTRIVDMAFSNDGVSFGPFEPFATSRESVALTTGDGAKSLHAKVRDDAENEGVLSATILLDTTAPEADFWIAGTPTHVTAAELTLVVTATDATSGLSEIAFSNDGSTFHPLTLVAGETAWTLGSGDGEKTIHGRFTDEAGNVQTVQRTVRLDATAPTLSVSLPAPFTRTREVQVQVLASDAGGLAEVCLSNDGATFTCGAHAPTVTWSLTAGDGAKTVTVKAMDAAGNTSQATASIVLDGTAPSGTLTIAAAAVRTRAVSLQLAVTDAGSGPGQMKFSNDGGFTWSSPEPVAATKAWTLPDSDGSHVVTARVTDLAGNEATFQTTVLLDRTVPTGMVVIGGLQSGFVRQTAVMLNITSSDTGSGLATAELANDTQPFGAPEPVPVNRAWTLAAGDGAKLVRVRLTDRAGNTAVLEAGATLDTTAPTGTLVLNGGQVATNATSVQAVITAADVGSGVESLCLRNVPGTPAAGDPCWSPFTGTVAHTLATTQGPVTVRAHLRDRLGWIGEATANIIYDTIAPTPPGSVTVRSSSHRAALVDWTWSTDADRVAHYELCSSATSGGPYNKCQEHDDSVPEHLLTELPNGRMRFIVVVAYDRAGNRSQSAQVVAYPRYPFEETQRLPTANTLRDVHLFTASEQLAIGDAGEVLRTTNRWSSSSRVDPLVDDDLHALAVDGSKVQAVGAGGAIVVSHDRGQSWKRSSSGTTQTLNGVAYMGRAGTAPFLEEHWVAVGINGTIRKLTQLTLTLCLGGICPEEQWSSTVTLTPATSATFEAVAWSASANVGIAVGSGGTIYRTVDRGFSWTGVNGPTSASLHSVTAVPGTSTFYASGASGTVIVSSNGGLTWGVLNASPALPTTGTIVAIRAATASRIYLAYQAGPTVRLHELNGTGATRGLGTDVDFSNPMGLGVYAADANAFTFVGHRGLINSTINGSATTPTYFHGASGQRETFSAIAFQPSVGSLWAVGNGGQTAFSANVGVSWVTKAPLTASSRHGLTPYQGNSTFAAGNGGTIWRWGAATETWILSATPTGTPTLRKVSCISALECYAAGGEETILRFNGSTWTTAQTNAGSGRAFYALATYVDAQSQSRAVAVTLDGGVRTLLGSTWTPRAGFTGSLEMHEVSARSSGVVVAVGSSGRIFRSTDHGVSWTQVSSGTSSSLYSVLHARDNLWYAAGAAGVILRSSDNGMSWQRLVSHSRESLLGLTAAQVGGQDLVWVAGSDGTILHSSTGGL